jgi:polyhydroxyalkanoate synthesis regulator phasin
MVRESVKAYLALASGLTEVTRQRAVAAAQALAAQGEATMDQVTTLADELITSSLANREAVTALVRAEVERTIARVAEANGDEVARLTAGLRSMEATLRETATWAADAVQEMVQARGPSGQDAAETWAEATSGVSATGSAAAALGSAEGGAPAGAAARSAAKKTAGAIKTAAKKPAAKKSGAAPSAAKASGTAAKKSGTSAAKKSGTLAAKKSGAAAKPSPPAAKASAATKRAAKKPAATKPAAQKSARKRS